MLLVACTDTTGYWDDGYYQGEGCLIYANGDKYEGNFEKGRFLGEGVFTLYHQSDKMKNTNNKTTTTTDGSSSSNNKTNNSSSAKEENTPETGYHGKYDGEYKHRAVNPRNGKQVDVVDGKRYGLGHRVYSNGTEYYGEWKDDK